MSLVALLLMSIWIVQINSNKNEKKKPPNWLVKLWHETFWRINCFTESHKHRTNNKYIKLRNLEGSLNHISYWGSVLTEAILIITRWRSRIRKLRFRLCEDGGKVERERYPPLTSQASHCSQQQWGNTTDIVQC